MSSLKPESSYLLQQALVVEKEREVPSLAGARELSNAREVTKQLKAIDDTKRGAHVSRKVEDIVGRRVGDRRPMWLAALMRGGRL